MRDTSCSQWDGLIPTQIPPALTALLGIPQTSPPQAGTLGPSLKPQCQPHWLPGPLAATELPGQSHPEEKCAATSLTAPCSCCCTRYCTIRASLLAPCSPLAAAFSSTSTFSSTSSSSLGHRQTWRVSGSPGSSTPAPMPPWDPMGDGLPAPHPPWALASSPLLVPWLHTSSLAGMQPPQVGAGGESWGCQGCRGLMGACRSLRPQGPVPQPLHFPQPSPLTSLSPCRLLSCVGTFTIRLLQTSTFQNTSFVDTEGLGLLEDIELGSLDKHTWTIRFYQPWVRPALPRSDWDTIENMIKIYLQKFNHLINKGAMQKDVPYPFVAQCMAGCEVYPNRTSRAFAYVGYNGQDFLSFNMDNATWILSQDTKLSQYVQAVLQNYTAFTELVEVLFNDTCVDDIEVLLHYGKAALERQEPPVATVFARMPKPDQLLLVCRVTGFYPRPISVAWLQDGQEVPPGPALNTSAILPNADLTYQLRSILAVAPHDGHSYACRVRHRSLGTRSLLIPWGNSEEVVLIAGLGAGLLAAVALAVISALWVWRHRKHQQMEESESRNSILSKEA
ncbi:antigen-presenting glycoprotein CD1d-like isoform 1-T1 [Morphnus guianensis]